MFVFFCDRLIPLSIMTADFIHAVTYVRSSFILILSNSPFYVFGCLRGMYGSAVACRRGRGSGCSGAGHGRSPLGGGHP